MKTNSTVYAEKYQAEMRAAIYADVIIGIKPRSLVNTGVRRINPNFPRLNFKQILGKESIPQRQKRKLQNRTAKGTTPLSDGVVPFLLCPKNCNPETNIKI